MYYTTPAIEHNDTEINTVFDRNGAGVRIAIEESDGRRYVTAGAGGNDPIELTRDDVLTAIETLTRAARAMGEWQ